jgi:hypothetical protein
MDFENAVVMSRKNLQDAREVEARRIESERICAEERIGLQWARRTVYGSVQTSAKIGLREIDVRVPAEKNFTSVSYAFALSKLKDWFPDCDITAPDYEALQDSVRRLIRISWACASYDSTTPPLYFVVPCRCACITHLQALPLECAETHPGVKPWEMQVVRALQ